MEENINTQVTSTDDQVTIWKRKAHNITEGEEVFHKDSR